MSAVVVAYGPEPWLKDCVEALLDSTGVDVDVVVVDNGDTSGAADWLASRPGVRVLAPRSNIGFAAGCNLGARSARGEVLALVNPDVVVRPDALGRLAAAALEPAVGIATASLRLGEDPERMNSAGNPVHFLGFAWAGGHGSPAAEHRSRTTVASASGACCALRKALWDELGGFEQAYFAYHEDVELSLRCWQRGQPVVYLPDAVAVHRYEFSRNRRKTMLLERNRLVTVLTVFSGRTLVLLAPALVLAELMVLGVAAAQGWLGAKLAGYRWLLGHVGLVRRRRARAQAARTRPDRDLAPLLAARLEPTNVAAVAGMPAANSLLAGYWAVVRRAL